MGTRVFALQAVTNYPDSARAQFNRPHQAVPDVGAVANDSICALARDAYNTSRPPSDSAYHLARVVVVRVGNDRFVVSPGARGKLLTRIIFDSLFQEKAAGVEF